MHLLVMLALLTSEAGQVKPSPKPSPQVRQSTLEQRLTETRQIIADYRDDKLPYEAPGTPPAGTSVKSKLQDVLSRSPAPSERERIAAEILLQGAGAYDQNPSITFTLQRLVAEQLLAYCQLKTVDDLPGVFVSIDRFESLAQSQKVSAAHAETFRLNFLAALPAGVIRRIDEQLDRCAAIAQDQSVWPGFRAGYWNLRGQDAANHSQFAEAYRCYEEAARLYASSQLPAVEAGVLRNLGVLSINLGDYSAARRQLEEAHSRLADVSRSSTLDQHTRDSLAFQQQLTAIDLARTVAMTGQLNSAVTQLTKVLTERNGKTDQDSGQLLAFARNERGMCLYNSGRIVEAKVDWAEARKKYDNIPAYAALVDVNLGWCELTSNVYGGAEQLFKTALENLTPDRQPETRSYLARVLALRGQQQEAARQLLQALDASEEQIRRTLQTALSERDRQAYLLKLRSHTEQSVWPGVFDTYLELAPALGISAQEQYRRVLRWKGILGNQASSSDTDGGGAARQTLVDRRDALLKNLRTLTIAGRKLEQRARLTAEQKQELKTLHDAIRQRDQELGDIDRDLRRLDESAPPPMESPLLDLEQVTAALSDKSALLDIVVTSMFRAPDGKSSGPPQRTIGFLVEKSGQVSRIDLGDAHLLAKYAEEFTTALFDQQPFAQPQEQLDQILGHPIQQQLPPVELLYVSGDGWVHRVPLGALSGKSHPFWIEEVAFAQVASAHALVRRHRDIHASEGALLVGGLDYGPGGGQVWPYLVGTWLESQQVETLLRAAYKNLPIDFLVAGQCDKTTLSAKLQHRRIVHLATHGFFQDRESDLGGIYDISSQMDSGLVLSYANHDPDTGEQYLLTAEELGRQKLDGIDLLVLSACNTGLGHLSHGEGIIGLLGALDRAGVRSVVSALWEVDDAATMILMEAFYKHCLTDDLAHPAQAMQKAQIQMLRGELTVEGREAETLHQPFFWAAWSVMGWSG